MRTYEDAKQRYLLCAIRSMGLKLRTLPSADYGDFAIKPETVKQSGSCPLTLLKSSILFFKSAKSTDVFGCSESHERPGRTLMAGSHCAKANEH